MAPLHPDQTQVLVLMILLPHTLTTVRISELGCKNVSFREFSNLALHEWPDFDQIDEENKEVHMS